MATYIYETIPTKPGEYPEQFELQQSMNDQPLTRHPKTGQPVRRLISGGLGIIGTGRDSGPSSPSGHGCGSGSCGCGH
ncbi:MAG: zinc ribbon domain-containing protein [Verrucomicrobia bacterium]|nr:zinc ribbon domain-containing protein [Verrucomicrobiota bacterium]